MNFKTHLAFGLLAGLSLFPFFSIKWYLFFPLVLFAALLPDADHPESKIGKKLGIFSKIINFFLGHRGITHSIWIPLVLGIVLTIFFGPQFGIPVFIGYLSHVLSDGLTKQGINLLHPITKLHISGFIQTGSAGEWVVFGLVLAGIVYKVVGILL